MNHNGAVTKYEYNSIGQLTKAYYPESPELKALQEQEAYRHGLHWQESVSGLSNGHLSSGEYTELSRLLVRMRNGSGFLPTTQVFRTEMYTYDANGNRATKTTAYGTITYSYDAENRLQKTCGDTGVGVEYAYDSNGNLLSQTSSLKHSIYEYNPQNRMVRSRVVDDEARTIASTRYGYDPLGRRTLVQDNNAATLRTLYDGLSFDVVKESPVYASGGFTDTYNTGIQYTPAGRATGERYRYLDDGTIGEKYRHIEDNEYQTVSSRYAGERAMLYAHGSPVAVNRGGGSRGYLSTDILGSTRSVTDNHGLQESYYDYDIFGSPVAGDFTTGADYGYLGKPYDSITGLYNYGYRDYSPQTVRFTTVDPIRDGSNWFAYVNNDPVNYVDLLGLLASDGKQTVVVKTSGMEFNVITVPSLTTGKNITITKGFLDAAFYVNESSVPDFTARYTYSITEKSGFEISVLGISVVAGEGKKIYTTAQSPEEIARDFTNAGTQSVSIGLTVAVGASISGSSSGGWSYNQSSFGVDGGLSVSVLGATSITETKLVEGSLKK